MAIFQTFWTEPPFRANLLFGYAQSSHERTSFSGSNVRALSWSSNRDWSNNSPPDLRVVGLPKIFPWTMFANFANEWLNMQLYATSIDNLYKKYTTRGYAFQFGEAHNFGKHTFLGCFYTWVLASPDLSGSFCAKQLSRLRRILRPMWLH